MRSYRECDVFGMSPARSHFGILIDFGVLIKKVAD